MHRLMKISKRIGLILNGRWFLRQLIIASIRPFDFHFFFSSEIDSVFLFAFYFQLIFVVVVVDIAYFNSIVMH